MNKEEFEFEMLNFFSYIVRMSSKQLQKKRDRTINNLRSELSLKRKSRRQATQIERYGSYSGCSNMDRSYVVNTRKITV